MGLYINPPSETKEQWINRHKLDGVVKFPDQPYWPDADENFLPICLVDNGGVTAAAVCFSLDEFRVFNDPIDPRPKTWHYILIDDLNKLFGQDLRKLRKERSRT